MLFKCTMNFRSNTTANRGGGWSESFVIDRSSFGTAILAFRPLMDLRAALLPNTSMIHGQRYALLQAPFTTQSANEERPGASGLLTDMPQIALELIGRSTAGNQRQIVLRNIPDARCQGGEFIVSDAYLAALNAFMAQLVANWVFVGRDKTNPLVSVVSVSPAGVVTTSADFTGVAGQQVRFFRTKNTIGQAIKGEFFIKDRAGGARSITLDNWTLGTVTRGKVRLVGTASFPFSSVTPIKTVIKKVGRPSGQFSGRASNRT